MRLLKSAAVLAVAFAFGDAYAFHDGGVAYCDGCHVMHNASNGSAATTKGGQPARSDRTNPFLLQGSDQSSTCLICHGGTSTGGYHIMQSGVAAGTAPGNYTPGGDFAYLLKDYTYVQRGTTKVSLGQSHGHNVIAKDFGLSTIQNNRAPGGAFQTGTGIAGLACSSCHDPHGRYRLQGDPANPVIRGPAAAGVAINPIVASGSYPLDAAVQSEMQSTGAVGVYRLLAGKSYRPFSNPGFPFTEDPPVAVAPKTYNQVESTNEVRVAYGKGMSEWCKNCHTYIHLDTYATGADGLVHPAGDGAKLRQLQADIYNRYKGSGDLTGTSQYTSLIPFESQVADVTQLGPAATNTAPVGSDATGVFVAKANQTNVMCLSCHRAHASAWDNMVRWNPVATFVTVDVLPGSDQAGNQEAIDMSFGRTQAETRAGYYGRDVGTGLAAFNRSLCNKCHAKD